MKSKYTFNEIEGFLDKCNATGIKILNGTSKQFLKADGSLDTKEYLSTTGGTIRGGILELDSSLAAYSFLRFKDRRINSTAYADNILKIIDADGISHGALGLYGRENGVVYYYLGCKNDAHNGNNFRVYADKVSFGESTILHSGNYVDLIGDTYLKTDGSNAMGAPLQLATITDLTKEKGLYVGRTNISGGAAFDYASFINIYDGQISSLQLSWFRNIAVPKLVARISENGAWGDWKTIAFTDSDITGNAIGLTGADGNIAATAVNGNLSLVGRIYWGDLDWYYISKYTETSGVPPFGKYKFYSGHIFECAAGQAMRINSSGYVTIGDQDYAGANHKLYVDGATLIKGNLDVRGTFFARDTSGISRFTTAWADDIVRLYASSSDGTTPKNIYFGDYQGNAFNIIGCNNVLIGTTESDGSKLQIRGSIKAYSSTNDLKLYTRILGSSVQVGRTSSSYTGGYNCGLQLGEDNTAIGFIAGAYNDKNLNHTNYFYGGKDSESSPFVISINDDTTYLRSSRTSIGYALEVNSTAYFGGQSTFNAGITIPSGKSITFVDANGNNHVLSWDDTAGGLKIDDKIITVN